MAESTNRFRFVEPVKLDKGPFLNDPTLTAKLLAHANELLAHWNIEPTPPLDDEIGEAVEVAE